MKASQVIHSKESNDQDLKNLEFCIEELVRICERLKNENTALRSQHQGLLAERAKLIEKTELAQLKIEAIVSRLDAMEHVHDN